MVHLHPATHTGIQRQPSGVVQIDPVNKKAPVHIGNRDASKLTSVHEGKFKKLLANQEGQMMKNSSWGPWRIWVWKLVMSPNFDAAMGVIIISQFGCAIHETNVVASGGEPPQWVGLALYFFLSAYIGELCLRVFAMHYEVLEGGLNRLDFLVVTLDVVVQAAQLAVGHLPSVTVFRIFRLIRLVRAFRVLTTYRELYIMMNCFVGSMKAIFWATVIMGIFITIWSIVFVEILHPLNVEIDYGDCERCSRAYESVMTTNLTLFQQIVAGDSWGLVTITILEKHPWTCIIYIPAFISIGMGMMNLVLTAIVDKAQDAREKNEQDKLSLKLQVVHALFEQMDDDGSGCVSLEEFEAGLRKAPEFQSALEVLGVRVDDIKTLFAMMDLDDTGTVSYDEFLDNLSKIKNEDSYIILLYMKHFMTIMEQKIESEIEVVNNNTLQLQSMVEEDLRREPKTNSKDFDLCTSNPNSSGGNEHLQKESSAEQKLGFKRDGVPDISLLQQNIEDMARRMEEMVAGQARNFEDQIKGLSAAFTQAKQETRGFPTPPRRDDAWGGPCCAPGRAAEEDSFRIRAMPRPYDRAVLPPPAVPLAPA